MSLRHFPWPEMLFHAQWFAVVDSARDCGSPPIIVDTYGVFDSFAPTTYSSPPLSYKCMDAHWFSRSQTVLQITCTASGVWAIKGTASSNTWPKCVRKFSALDSCGRIRSLGELLTYRISTKYFFIIIINNSTQIGVFFQHRCCQPQIRGLLRKSQLIVSQLFLHLLLLQFSYLVSRN